jgi:probable phosphoglycerate mutase
MPLLDAVTFAYVLASPLGRARQTCALTCQDRMMEIEPDLAEWNYGEYEGKLTAAIREERPDWNPFRDGCPGGEMPQQISDRADRLIAKLCRLKGNVALFTHGEFAAVLAARWIEAPVSEGPRFPLSTASLSILGPNPSHPEVRAIALWNALPAVLRT